MLRLGPNLNLELQEFKAENSERRCPAVFCALRVPGRAHESGQGDASSPFRSAPLHGVNYIDVNLIDDVYFSEIQVFYDPRQSRDGSRLDSNNEGDARPDKVRSRRY
jgi:hypothetical protein